MTPSLPLMKNRSKILVTVASVLALTGLGAADWMYGGDVTGNLIGGEEPETVSGGVAKNVGPSIQSALDAHTLTGVESDELTLLSQTVTDGTAIDTLAILKDGDRVGSVTCVETPRVKDYFASLKDALLTAFSPQMRDLRDETLREEGKPVRNILTFLDPVLSEERIVFVRVRERLCEFHTVVGDDAVMTAFIDELTAR